MNVGAAIKRLRKAKKWDQKDLALMLNVSNKTISSWECNRTEPNMEMIEIMCVLFGVSKSEFFQETSKVADYVYTDEKMGQIVVEIPEKRQELFTALNKTAVKLSDADLKKVLGIIKAFDNEDSEEGGNDHGIIRKQ